MIKDFIKAFVETYHKVYKDKISAKDCIDFTYRYKKYIDEICKKAKTVKTYLYDIFKFLPKDKRKDCVQQTIDLLKYEYKNQDGIHCTGMIDLYMNLSNMIDRSLIKMKTHYSKHEYQKVMDVYKEMIDVYNKTVEQYDCNEYMIVMSN